MWESRIAGEISQLSRADRLAIMLRILLLAPGSNPDGITGPLIGHCYGEASARLHVVTLITEVINV
jgi:hypothetical protein